MDKRSLIIGIIFLLISAYCIFDLLTQEFRSFALTGFFVFTIVGIGFIKKSKSR